LQNLTLFNILVQADIAPAFRASYRVHGKLLSK
jgi:hypothetical protein